MLKRSLAALAVIVLVLLLWSLFFRPAQPAVVLYCAHDLAFADPVLREFTRATGIRVLVKFDSEATKSLGLVEQLAQEREHPQADVFWNNEALGSMDLAERGVLAPYRGPGWERIPAAYRDADGRWAGFAARLRVELEAADGGGAARLAADGAIAKPLYGTTLTHYSALWARHGGDAVKRWHAATRAAGLAEVDGNAQVRRVVAEGGKRWGLTDTDDAFEAIDAGRPVRMTPARVRFLPALAGTADDPGAPTIVIPNTVALVAGGPHPAQARMLIDYLLSAGTELALARSAARQVPLGPLDESALPAEVRALRPAVAEGLPLAGLLTARRDCLAWLKTCYAP